MNNKLGQEPAFASSYDEFDGHDTLGNKQYVRINNIGMSKRFYAACAAMQGILSTGIQEVPMSGHVSTWDEKSIVEKAYSIADEILRQEKNELND